MTPKNYSLKFLIVFSFCCLNLIIPNAAARSAEKTQLAICDFGNTFVYLNKENSRLSYEQVTEVFNEYTNQYDVYTKTGEAQIVSFKAVSNRNYVFYLDGYEKSESPYYNETFELDYISMLNGEMWIRRKGGGNKATTIHVACKITDQQELP